MHIIEHCSLTDKHSFHLDAKARYWAEFSHEEEALALLSDQQFAGLPRFVVGGGSNLLFTADYPGLLLHPAIQGTSLVDEDKDTVFINVGAGETWDDFVAESVAKGWYGAENLSGIPGCVGASPVQNIGAYGVEAKDLIDEVEALDLVTGLSVKLNQAECRFGYRDSVFKHRLKNALVITRVRFRLSTRFQPNLNYGDLARRVMALGDSTPALVRDTILTIRHEKLPDPDNLGNAGSFFMNPVIPAAHYHSLLATYPDMPGWPQSDDTVKVPAAWCIERTGWKGKQLGGAAVHDKQPLVLVNKGGATATDLLNLSAGIQADVLSAFGIHLKPEVLFIQA